MTDLAHFMAGIRQVESGDARGNYSHRQKPQNGIKADGAYGFSDWRRQATAVGYGAANIRDTEAQDRVAASTFRDLYQRLGSWELVALAWFTNEKTADQARMGGYSKVAQITNPRVKEYVQSVVNAMAQAEGDDNQYTSPTDHIPLSEPPEQVQPKRTYQASELMATFVEQLSSANAGGQRTSIDELAPKRDPQAEVEAETETKETSGIDRLIGGGS